METGTRQCEPTDPEFVATNRQGFDVGFGKLVRFGIRALRELLAEIVEHDLVMQTIARTVALQAFDRPAFVRGRPKILAIRDDRREVGQMPWLAFDGAEIIERNISDIEPATVCPRANRCARR
jgi:hypothetical protein